MNKKFNLVLVKDTVMEIEKVLVNDPVRVSKVF